MIMIYKSNNLEKKRLIFSRDHSLSSPGTFTEETFGELKNA